jgi:hypothetical protein
MSFSNLAFQVNSGIIPQLTTGLIVLLTVVFKTWKKAFVYIGVTALLIVSINKAHSFAVNTNCPPGHYFTGGSGTGLPHQCVPYGGGTSVTPSGNPYCSPYPPTPNSATGFSQQLGCTPNNTNNSNYWGQPNGNQGYYPYPQLQFHTSWGGGNWGAPWYYRPQGASPYAPYCAQCMQNNPMYNQMYNPWHQQSNQGGGNWHGPAS